MILSIITAKINSSVIRSGGRHGSRPCGGFTTITQRKRRNMRPIYFDDDLLYYGFRSVKTPFYGLLRTAQD